jgi:hypothetical protein
MWTELDPLLRGGSGVSTFVLRSVALVHIPALSPLGERVARRRRFLQPGRAG